MDSPSSSLKGMVATGVGMGGSTSTVGVGMGASVIMVERESREESLIVVATEAPDTDSGILATGEGGSGNVDNMRVPGGGETTTTTTTTLSLDQSAPSSSPLFPTITEPTTTTTTTITSATSSGAVTSLMSPKKPTAVSTTASSSKYSDNSSALDVSIGTKASMGTDSTQTGLAQGSGLAQAQGPGLVHEDSRGVREDVTRTMSMSNNSDMGDSLDSYSGKDSDLHHPHPHTNYDHHDGGNVAMNLNRRPSPALLLQPSLTSSSTSSSAQPTEIMGGHSGTGTGTGVGGMIGGINQVTPASYATVLGSGLSGTTNTTSGGGGAGMGGSSVSSSLSKSLIETEKRQEREKQAKQNRLAKAFARLVLGGSGVTPTGDSKVAVPLGAFGEGRLSLPPGRKGEVIPVREEELATIIAYSLASQVYHRLSGPYKYLTRA